MPDSKDHDEISTASALARDSALIGGRYRVERTVGAGAMATVFMAHDEQHGRKVAIKVLRPRVAATLAKDRFLREIQVSARLSHPHIVGLIDSGEFGGMLWYAMPYVEGETLRKRIEREGPLPFNDVVRIGRELADALAAAHEEGIVHRDVKPENVMLAGRHALMMDFGVARAMRDAGSTGTLTLEGTVVGTPDYMAPEQAAADPQLTPAMDVFALGLVLYEMLTGKTPFGELPPSRRLAAMVRQNAPPVGSRRDDVPPALARLVHACLMLAPEQRPSAMVVVEEFELLQGDPSISGSHGRVPRPAATTASRATPASAAPSSPAAAPAGPRVPRWVIALVVAAAALLLLWGATLLGAAPVVR